MPDSDAPRRSPAAERSAVAAPPAGARRSTPHPSSELKLGVTRYGPRIRPDGTQFRLWAPDLDAVEVEVDGRTVPLAAVGDGWFAAVAAGVGPGARYRFRSGDLVFPDPASRCQDGDLDDRSIVVKPALAWRNKRLGRPWTEAVIAEIHVGTATPEGTFRALVDRLPHYAETGFTAIELMPVADFPGRRGWGYDAVLAFAPDRTYGGPEDLAYLIRRAHDLGLAVILDVVHNHFGPVANHLRHYASAFFDPATTTPWGPAIDLSRAEVRRYFIESALHWVEDYGFDGLRFDAVHALQPAGRARFLRELAETLNGLEPRPWLILENEHNEADLLSGGDGGDPERYRAQWNDDFHHVFHVAVTGEAEGYYAAYADAPRDRIARVLAEGFDYQGQGIVLRAGAPRGQPSGHLHPSAFVSFLQNHDQIGNRAFGERLTDLAGPEPLRVLAFALLLSPQIPMLFMGEEWATRQPFCFFCDYQGDMAEAVRSGRRAEFAAFEAFRDRELPDPVAEATFEASKLDWERLETSEGAAALAETRRLIALRREIVVPRLASAYRGGRAGVAGDLITAEWRFEAGSYGLALNLSDKTRFARVAKAEPAGAVGGVTGGTGHWLFEPWSGAVWVAS